MTQYQVWIVRYHNQGFIVLLMALVHLTFGITQQVRQDFKSLLVPLLMQTITIVVGTQTGFHCKMGTTG